MALVVVVGWGSSVGAWSTGAGGDPNWGSTTFGGTGSDRAYGGVAVDGSGNVYTTGAFSGTVNFGAGNVTAAGTGTWGDVAWIDYEALSTGISQHSDG